MRTDRGTTDLPRRWRSAHRRFARRALAAAVWLSLVTVYALVSVRGWLHPGFVVGSGLAAVLVGMAIADFNATRESVRRALRWQAAGGAERRSVRRRVRAAALLALPAFALSVLLVPVASWRPRFPEPAETAEAAPQRGPGGDGLLGLGSAGANGAGSGWGADASGRLTSDATRKPSDDPWLLRRVLLELSPSQGGVPTGFLGPLYVRGSVYTDVESDGTWTDRRDAAATVRDADDGALDGWCELAPRAAPADAVEFELRQRVVTHPALGHPVVHAPAGLAAVRLASVRSVPEGTVLAPDVQGTELACGLAGTLPSRLPFPTPRTRVVDRDPRATELPRGDPSVDELARLAARVTRAATDDLERVRSVVRHLRSEFSYAELGGEISGHEGLREFLGGQGGTCVQFAEATATMLRSQGIPCRVVHGYLAHAWDDERGCYVARGRDYHAWVEVPFEGCGWVTFDATPRAPEDLDQGAGRPRPPGPDDGPGALTRAVSSVQATARVAIGAATDAFSEHSWLAPALALLLAAGAWWFVRRRTVRLSTPTAAAGLDGTPWGRLLAVLARRGHRRLPTQTATEFAAAVVAREGDAMVPFVAITRRQQAARFGGAPLTGEDLTEIELFRRSLG